MLPDNLDGRVAEAIRHTIDHERESTDTASPCWRLRCEVAHVASLPESERRVFLSHVASNRGDAVAGELAQSAGTLRTEAIFILARRPS